MLTRAHRSRHRIASYRSSHSLRPYSTVPYRFRILNILLLLLFLLLFCIPPFHPASHHTDHLPACFNIYMHAIRLCREFSNQRKMSATEQVKYAKPDPSVVPPHRTLFLFSLFLAVCGTVGFVAGGANRKSATALMFGGGGAVVVALLGVLSRPTVRYVLDSYCVCAWRPPLLTCCCRCMFMCVGVLIHSVLKCVVRPSTSH